MDLHTQYKKSAPDLKNPERPMRLLRGGEERKAAENRMLFISRQVAGCLWGHLHRHHIGIQVMHDPNRTNQNNRQNDNGK